MAGPQLSFSSEKFLNPIVCYKCNVLKDRDVLPA